MASLKDIAEATGVSIRTVSRALKNDGYVSPDTRKKIRKAAENLGYRANLAARSLKTGKTYEVAAILQSMDELYMTKLAGFEQTMREAGYSVNVIFEPCKNRVAVLQTLKLRRSAGAAIFPDKNNSALEETKHFASCGVPYVIVDTLFDTPCNCVVIDRAQGVCESVRYLLSQGHKTIAYMGFTPTVDSRQYQLLNNWRLEGYIRAAEETSMEKLILNSPPAEDEYQGGILGAEQLLNLSKRPDAVQVFSDVMAMGILAGLHERKISVPNDIAVVGFDNRSFASMSWPPLTTVSQPNRDAGRIAAEILLDKLNENSDELVKRTLTTRLIVRSSA